MLLDLDQRDRQLFWRDDSPNTFLVLTHAAYLHLNGEVIIKPASIPQPPPYDFVTGGGFVVVWWNAGTKLEDADRDIDFVLPSDATKRFHAKDRLRRIVTEGPV